MNSNTSSLFIMIALLAVMYFILIRPQRKKEKEDKLMRDNLKVGDEIITIGGVIGKVVRIKDDRVTIATSAAQTKLEFTRSAIGRVLGKEDQPSSDAKAQKQSAEPERATPKNIKKLGAKEEVAEAVTEAAEEIKEEISETVELVDEAAQEAAEAVKEFE